MREISKFTIALLSLLTLTIWGTTRAFSQDEPQQHFPETGHVVSGAFLDFYYQIPNPDVIYGYPITGVHEDPTTGTQIQYFNRARFELGDDGTVRLTPLGERLYEPVEPFPITTNTNVCRAFETGFQVCYSFLHFFDEHGGLAQFGPPISPVEMRDARFVQYFQNARFEWHPETTSAGQEVRLTELGFSHFYATGKPLGWMIPDFLPPIILTIQVHAFPAEPVVSARETQSIFVVVQNQSLGGIEAASVDVEVRLPTGESQFFLLSPTNNFGITNGELPLTLTEANVGLAEVEVVARFADYEKRTLTSFRIVP